jgi:tetratricopeptide (TPR) repeat protein
MTPGDVERWLDEGNRLFAAGAWSSAVDAYRNGLAELPTDERDGVLAAHLLNGLGNSERNEANHDEAVAALEEALAIFKGHDPASTETGSVMNNLGYALLSAGDLGRATQLTHEALAILQKAAPDSPELRECLDNVSKCDILRGDHAGAKATAEEALRVALVLGRGDLDLASRRLVLGLLSLELGDASAAVESLDRALALYRPIAPRGPEVFQALQGLARAHEALGQHEEAVRHLREAVEIAEEAVGGPETT